MTTTRSPLTALAPWLSLIAVCVLSTAATAQQAMHHSPSFMEYLPARYGATSPEFAFTRVQLMQPLHSQRVVNYDGTARLGNGIGAVLSTREVGHAVEGGQSSAIVDGINLATGAWVGQLPGIDLPATMPWSIGVAYNSVGEAYTTSATLGSYHGPGWSQTSQPEIAFYSQAGDPGFIGTPDDVNDVVYVVFGTGRYAAYQRESTGSDVFIGVNGVGGIVKQTLRSGMTPEQFELIDQLGQKFVFFGFESDVSQTRAHGQLWKKIATNGEAAYVGDETNITTAISSGYDTSGRITDAYDSEGRHFEYTYSAGPGSTPDVLTKVEAKAPITSAVIATVEYSYYDPAVHIAALGDGTHPAGYLRSVTRTTPTSIAGQDIERSEYVRYDNVSSTSAPIGGPAVSLVISSQGIALANPSPPSSGSAMNLGAMDALTTDSLKIHADIGLSHDHAKGSGRVIEYFGSGDCGCGGSVSDQTIEIAYDTNTSLPFYLEAEVDNVTLTKEDEYIKEFALDPGGQPLRIESDELPDDGTGSEDCVTKCVTVIRRSPNGIITGVGRKHVDCSDTNGNGIPDNQETIDYTHCTTLKQGEYVFNSAYGELKGELARGYVQLYRFRYEFDCTDLVYKRIQRVRDWSNPLERDAHSIVTGYIEFPSKEILNGEQPNCTVDLESYFVGDKSCSVSDDEIVTVMEYDDAVFTPTAFRKFDEPVPQDLLDNGFCPFAMDPYITADRELCVCSNLAAYPEPLEVEFYGKTIVFYYNWRYHCPILNIDNEGREIYAVVVLGSEFQAANCDECADPSSVLFVEEAVENPQIPIPPSVHPSMVDDIVDNGNIDEYFYDSRGVKVIPPKGHDDYSSLISPEPLFARHPIESRTNLAGETTDYTYTWYTGAASMRPKTVTMTREVVTTGRNGSGASNESTTYYREDGTVAFVEHPDGRVDYTLYDDDQQLVVSVTDVTGGFSNPAGYPTVQAEASGFAGLSLPTSGNGADLASEYEYDAQGRSVSMVSPTTRTGKTIYARLNNQYSVRMSSPHFDGTDYHSPVSISLTDLLGRTIQSGTIAFTGGKTSSAPSTWLDVTATDLQGAVNVGTLASLQEIVYDGVSDRVTYLRAFYDIDGSTGNQYDETSYAYDDRNRRVKTIDPTGTIDRMMYDNRNRVVSSWTGTDDSGWDDVNGGGGNMVKVSEAEYDNGDPQGPGLVTKETLFPDGGSVTSTQRVTEYVYDSQRRLKVIKNPLPPHAVIDYDAADRPIFQAYYSGSSPALNAATSAAQPHPDRVSLNCSRYDEQGRVYTSLVYGVDRSTGDLNGHEFASRVWYDPSGRTVKTTGASVIKNYYDSAGRLLQRFVLAADKDADVYSGAMAGATASDIVLSESRSVYDLAGRLIKTIAFDRRHDQGMAVVGAMDNSNSDFTDDTKGRVSVSAIWYDKQDRVTHLAFYGDVNSDPAYNAAVPPGPGIPGVLVSQTLYDDAGRSIETVDPTGRRLVMEFDDLGRTVVTIENYLSGMVGPSVDEDRKTYYTYENGLHVAMTAHQVDAALGDQTTYYDYSVPRGTADGQSTIASNRLLHTAQYPDSGGGSDVVTKAYNALGEPVQNIDQSGNELEISYDELGRPIHLRVAAAATGFDATVQRISTIYNDLGQVTSIAQWDDEDPTEVMANVLNELTYAYDDWGQLTTINQDFNSAVNATGSVDHYTIEYTHSVVDAAAAAGAWQGISRTQRLLKGHGSATHVQEINYLTGAGGSIDEMLQRTTSITYGTGGNAPATTVSYEYHGVGRVVGTSIPVTGASVDHLLYNPVTGDLDHIDQFGRVTRDLWVHDDGTVSTNLIDRTMAHDNNGNILSVDHAVWGMDRTYELDGLDRLIDEKRGILTNGQISDPNDKYYQNTWTYDSLGNQLTAIFNFDGDSSIEPGDGERDRKSTFNKANELVTFDDDQSTSGGALSALHDAVGNLINDGENYEYEYDVFGRLVAVYQRNGASANTDATAVTRYSYNGAGHRIAWISNNEDDPPMADGIDADDSWTFGVYDERWRLIAEVDAPAGYPAATPNGAPTKLWLHHHAGLSGSGISSYIDSLVRVDTDTTANGTFDTVRRYVQNWRHDVVMMLDDSGQPVVNQEQDYTAYGESLIRYRSDFDQDGDVDLGDFGTFNLAFNSSSGDPNYDPRADFDSDGDVDLGDFSVFGSEFNGKPGPTDLMADAAGRGYAGYVEDDVLAGTYHIRHRVYRSRYGAWINRDPLEYIDGSSVYDYVKSSPIRWLDPSGLRCGDCVPPTVKDNRYDIKVLQLEFAFGNPGTRDKGLSLIADLQVLDALDSIHKMAHVLARVRTAGRLSRNHRLRLYNKELEGIVTDEVVTLVLKGSVQTDDSGSIQERIISLIKALEERNGFELYFRVEYKSCDPCRRSLLQVLCGESNLHEERTHEEWVECDVSTPRNPRIGGSVKFDFPTLQQVRNCKDEIQRGRLK